MFKMIYLIQSILIAAIMLFIVTFLYKLFSKTSIFSRILKKFFNIK